MKTKSGQLLNGDCLELMGQIPDGSVDMVLCDLPYGTTACSWDSIIPFELLWSHYWRVAKPNAAIVLTAAQPFTTMLISSQMNAFKYEWIWKKESATQPQNAKNKPMPKHENICVFSKAPCGHVSQLGDRRMVYNPQGVISTGKIGIVKSRKSNSYMGARPNQTGKQYEIFTGYPNSILEFPRDREKIHPTQKPVALFEYLIRTYTNEGETVLDNCSDSGTTAIAAINSGRRFICIERDPVYYWKSLTRVLDAEK